MPSKSELDKKSFRETFAMGTVYNSIFVVGNLDEDSLRNLPYTNLPEGSFYYLIDFFDNMISKKGSFKDITNTELGYAKRELLAYSLGVPKLFEVNATEQPDIDRQPHKRYLDEAVAFADEQLHDTPYHFGLWLLADYFDNPEELPLFALKHYIPAPKNENHSRFTGSEMTTRGLDEFFKRERKNHPNMDVLLKRYRSDIQEIAQNIS